MIRPCLAHVLVAFGFGEPQIPLQLCVGSDSSRCDVNNGVSDEAMGQGPGENRGESGGGVLALVECLAFVFETM